MFDVGNYLSLFLLDSGHQYNIAGEQTQWLQRQMSTRGATPYKMAAYISQPILRSIPTTPVFQHRSARSGVPCLKSTLFRWPLSTTIHAYKRNHPLKEGQIDPEQECDLHGSGSWGVSPRQPKKLWYLNKTAKVNAVCLVTLASEKGGIEALSAQGKVIDAVVLSP